MDRDSCWRYFGRRSDYLEWRIALQMVEENLVFVDEVDGMITSEVPGFPSGERLMVGEGRKRRKRGCKKKKDSKTPIVDGNGETPSVGYEHKIE